MKKQTKDPTLTENIKIALVKKKMTKTKLAEELNLTQAALCYKFRENFWRKPEIYFMKNALNFDLD